MNGGANERSNMADHFTEALIAAVRQHPAIYNVTDPDYRIFDKKQKAWHEISRNLKRDCDVLKTRWRSLRDCYSKYKRTLLKTNDYASKQYKKWPWAQQMSFVDAATSVRSTSSHVVLTAPTTFTTTASVSTVISPESEVKQEIMSDHGNDTTVDNHSIGRRKRRIRPADPVCTVVNYVKDRDQYRSSKSGIDLLFRSYAETFKKYSPLTQARVKIDMAKLFAEAEICEIKQLQRPSYRISAPSLRYITDSSSATPSP